MKTISKPLSILALVALPVCANANQEGAPSEVQSIYVGTDTNARPYITFKDSNSMPGCHGNSGGYLYGDDIDKAYSTILAALKSKTKIKPYFQVNPNNDGWSRCYIKAISAY